MAGWTESEHPRSPTASRRWGRNYQDLDAAIQRDHLSRPWREIADSFGVSKATFYRRSRALGIKWPRKYPDGYYTMSPGKRRNLTRQDRYRTDPEYRAAVGERSTAWAKANREKYMLRSVRSRAARCGIPFDLDVSDMAVPETCPVLGIPLEWKGDKRHDGSPSLDRVRPELGYVKGNVRVISWRANRIKNDGTADEHMLIASWMRAMGGR